MFPTLYWFDSGVVQDYTGGAARKKETFFNWVMKASRRLVSERVTCEEMMKKAEEAIKNLVYFGPFEGLLWKAFTDAAATDRTWKYYHVPIGCAPSVAGYELKRTELVAAVRAFD